jgi:hypothetical protein
MPAMFQRGGSAQVFGAALIAALSVVAPHVAQAQSVPPSKPAARPAAKPVAQPTTMPVMHSVDGADQVNYWSVNTSLPSQYGTERPRPQARPAADRARATGASDNTTQLGRVPLRDAPGSIGFTSGQSASSGQFHDGRAVPGLNPHTQKESSYVGVSLSVTSASKGLPVPLPTPWGRPE